MGFQAALTAAQASSGATEVQVAPGTYDAGSGGLVYTTSSSTNPLTLVGMGEVVIEGLNLTGSVARTLSVGGTGSVVRNFTIRVGPGLVADTYRFGLELVRAGARDVRVVGVAVPGSQGGLYGIDAYGVSTPVDVIDVSVDTTATATMATFYPIRASLVNLTRARVSCASASVRHAAWLSAASVTNSHFTCGEGLLLQSSSLDSSVIRTTSSSGTGVYAFAGNSTLDGVTLIGPKSVGSVGASASSANSHVNLTVLNSIITGFGTARAASASNVSYQARVDAAYSLLKLSAASTSGNAFVTCDIGCIDEATTSAGLFSDTDWRLSPGSGVVDKGNPAPPAEGRTDVLGSVRALDGDRNGTATRDMGAYEAGWPSAAATGIGAVTAQPATFVASGSDPNPGEPLSYSWTFDDGTSAGGASVQHAFATAGAHTGTVTVTDDTGRSSSAQVTVTISEPAAQTPVDTGNANGTPSPPADVSRPLLTALRVTPDAFQAGSFLPAMAAGVKPSIRFLLSEPAAVILRFASLRPGVRQGDRCVPTKARTRGKPCRRAVPVGRALPFVGKLGKNRVLFSGRLDDSATLPPGRYRVSAVATDAAGNASEVATAKFRVKKR